MKEATRIDGTPISEVDVPSMTPDELAYYREYVRYSELVVSSLFQKHEDDLLVKREVRKMDLHLDGLRIKAGLVW